MTIREILDADWNVSEITVTVRMRETTKYIMEYRIGKNVEPGNSQRLLYELEVGDVYGCQDMKVLFIRRIIQHCQLENLPKSRIGLRGVLDKEIPEEIMKLTVTHMAPQSIGRSDGLHGYHFTCYVDNWSGIPGENKQISIDEISGFK